MRRLLAATVLATVPADRGRLLRRPAVRRAGRLRRDRPGARGPPPGPGAPSAVVDGSARVRRRVATGRRSAPRRSRPASTAAVRTYVAELGRMIAAVGAERQRDGRDRPGAGRGGTGRLADRAAAAVRPGPPIRSSRRCSPTSAPRSAGSAPTSSRSTRPNWTGSSSASISSARADQGGPVWGPGRRWRTLACGAPLVCRVPACPRRRALLPGEPRGDDRQQPQRQGVRLRCTRSSRPAASSTRSPRAT